MNEGMGEQLKRRRTVLRMGLGVIVSSVAGCVDGQESQANTASVTDPQQSNASPTRPPIGTRTATATASSDTAGAEVGTSGEVTATVGSISPTLQAELLPTDGSVNDSDDFATDFGGAVAVDGNTAVVGAGTHSGDLPVRYAYVFESSDGVWTQTAVLTPETTAEEKFGYDVAIDGDTIVVGAPYNEGMPAATYFFDKRDSAWEQRPRVRIGTGDSNSWFGTAVSVDDGTALVGAVQDSEPNGLNSGATYVFERVDGSWRQTAKLAARDGDEYDEFGFEMALSDDFAVIGAWKDETPSGSETGGSVYVFERIDDDLIQRAKLVPEDTGDFDTFGSELAVSGHRILVGSSFDSKANGDFAGAGYVFQRSDDGWTQTAKLAPTDGDREDWFGTGVAIAENVAVLGAKRDEDPNAKNAGAAYVFVNADEEWTQRAKFAPADGKSNDQFGAAVALTGRTALVGADKRKGPNGRPGGTVSVYKI